MELHHKVHFTHVRYLWFMCVHAHSSLYTCWLPAVYVNSHVDVPVRPMELNHIVHITHVLVHYLCTCTLYTCALPVFIYIPICLVNITHARYLKFMNIHIHGKHYKCTLPAVYVHAHVDVPVRPVELPFSVHQVHQNLSFVPEKSE